jgi:hypothetical protein
MMRAKLGLLGLCAVVLGLMAFSASPAHAAKWLILNAKGELKTGTELKATFSAELEDVHVTVLVPDILGAHFSFLCSAKELIGALGSDGSVLSGLKALFKGCKVLLDGTLNEACEPHSAGSPVGTVETASLKGLLVSVGGAARIRIEPETGETFANINMGEECPIGETLPVKGVLYLVDNALATHSVRHLSTGDLVNTDLWVLNKILAHKIIITGASEMFLTGAHKGLKWSGDAP